MELIKKMGLGTVQFGVDYGISNSNGKADKSEVKKILDTARKSGVEYLDTASGYGNAESILGDFNLSSFKVISKFLPFDQKRTLTEVLQSSLRDLKIKCVYGYLAHRPLSLLNSNYWSELKILKEQGLIKKIGFSLNTVEELDLLLSAGMHPDLIQVPFNYFDMRFEDKIKELRQNNCEIHTRSTFLQGLFFLNPDELSSHFDEVKPHLKKLKVEQECLEEFLLNFVVNNDFIDKVIIGVQNTEQLKANINNLKIEMSIPKFTEILSEQILMPSNWPVK